MAEPATKMETTLELLREQGTLRPRDLARLDIPPDYLDRLCRRGLVDRVARGLYAWPDAEVGEHHSLAEAARLVPGGSCACSRRCGSTGSRPSHPTRCGSRSRSRRGHPRSSTQSSGSSEPAVRDSPRWSRKTRSKGSP